MLNLSLPLLGLGFKSTSLNPGFCWFSSLFGVESHFWVLCLFLVNNLGGWNQLMWLVSSRRQGMLTVEPTRDPKCRLNISSFLTLPHLLDCLICTRNSVSIVFFWWMIRGWDRWVVVDSYQDVGGGTGAGYYLIGFFIFAFVFLSLMPCLFFKWVEHDSCCVSFFYYLFCCLRSL